MTQFLIFIVWSRNNGTNLNLLSAPSCNSTAQLPDSIFISVNRCPARFENCIQCSNFENFYKASFTIRHNYIQIRCQKRQVTLIGIRIINYDMITNCQNDKNFSAFWIKMVLGYLARVLVWIARRKGKFTGSRFGSFILMTVPFNNNLFNPNVASVFSFEFE